MYSSVFDRAEMFIRISSEEKKMRKESDQRNPAIPTKKSYQRDEVMKDLEISRATFYRMVHRVNDPLPALKTGSNGYLRVPVKEFEEWKQKHWIDTVGLRNNG
jgi:predicted DNA-binding transcriptional regulator AlpA